MRVDLRSRQEMGSRDGGAKVAQLATDNLHVHDINADDAELLHSDDVAQDAASNRRPQVLLIGHTQLLDDAANRRRPAALSHKPPAHIIWYGGIDGSVEVQAHAA